VFSIASIRYKTYFISGARNPAPDRTEHPGGNHTSQAHIAAFMDHLERSLPDGSATASTRDIAILVLLFFFQLPFLLQIMLGFLFLFFFAFIFLSLITHD
jgi:hypothetical protein